MTVGRHATVHSTTDARHGRAGLYCGRQRVYCVLTAQQPARRGAGGAGGLKCDQLKSRLQYRRSGPGTVGAGYRGSGTPGRHAEGGRRMEG